MRVLRLWPATQNFLQLGSTAGLSVDRLYCCVRHYCQRSMKRRRNSGKGFSAQPDQLSGGPKIPFSQFVCENAPTHMNESRRVTRQSNTIAGATTRNSAGTASSPLVAAASRVANSKRSKQAATISATPSRQRRNTSRKVVAPAAASALPHSSLPVSSGMATELAVRQAAKDAALTPPQSTPSADTAAAAIDGSASTVTAKKQRPRKTPRMPAASAAALAPELRDKALRIAEQLAVLFPAPAIPLDHESPFQLLVAVMLSAQSTDKKVNEITPALFKLAPDAVSVAALEVSQIEALVKQIGLAPTKSKNISNMSKLLVERHGGEVPGSVEELEALPGVGHKTASVVLCQAFGKAAFPVDTHIHRLAQRWGLSSGRSVEQTEADLKALFPEEAWRQLHLRIIYLGRGACPAKAHDPTACPLCSWAAVAPYDQPGSSPLKPGQGTKVALARLKQQVTDADGTTTTTEAVMLEASLPDVKVTMTKSSGVRSHHKS